MHTSLCSTCLLVQVQAHATVAIISLCGNTLTSKKKKKKKKKKEEEVEEEEEEERLREREQIKQRANQAESKPPRVDLVLVVVAWCCVQAWHSR